MITSTVVCHMGVLHQYGCNHRPFKKGVQFQLFRNLMHSGIVPLSQKSKSDQTPKNGPSDVIEHPRYAKTGLYRLETGTLCFSLVS